MYIMSNFNVHMSHSYEMLDIAVM